MHKQLMKEWLALMQAEAGPAVEPRIPMASFEEESPFTEPYADPVIHAKAGLVDPPAALPPDVPEECRPGPEVLEDLAATVRAPEVTAALSHKAAIKTVLPPQPTPEELEAGAGAGGVNESQMNMMACYLAALGPRSHRRNQQWRHPAVGKVFL